MHFQTILQSKGVRYIASGWVFFISENLILSHNRTEIIDQFGDDNYHRLYNSLSTLACGGLAYSYYYYGRRQGPLLHQKLGHTANFIGFTLQSLGLVGLSQLAPPFQLPVAVVADSEQSPTPSALPVPIKSSSSLNVRCPIDLKAYRAGKDRNDDSAYGIERVSRHATLWSLGLLSLGSAASTIFIPEMVMYGFPIVFAYIGTTHQDYRRKYCGHLPTLTKEIEESTSNIPFLALLRGSQSWDSLSNEIKWTNAAMAVSAATLFALRRMR